MQIEKIQECIKKFQMELATQNGVEGIRVGKKPTAEQVEEIKANKPAILAELHRQDEEYKARKLAAREAVEAERESLIKSGEAKLALVFSGSYLLDAEIAYVAKLSEVEQEKYHPDFQGRMHKLVRSIKSGKGIREAAYELKIIDRKPEGCLHIESAIRYITGAEMDAMLGHIADTDAKRKADAEAKKAAQAAELQVKFDEAKSTGKPVVIRSYMVPCNDPREECDADNVVEYAMPDGTRKTKQFHTW